jgi:hypothetical protein
MLPRESELFISGLSTSIQTEAGEIHLLRSPFIESGKSGFYFVVEIGGLESSAVQAGSVDIRPRIAVQSMDDGAEFLHGFQMEAGKLW